MTQIDWQELLEQAVRSINGEYRDLDVDPAYEPAPPREVMVPMSDGISLYTVCQTPQAEGPFPTIVMRSCYPYQDVIYKIHAQEYCKRGFAFVYQFCRGMGGSEGIWLPNVHDRQDGKETLDWLSGQAWVESIGYWGSSYLAFTGWIVGDILPGKVKTMYLTHYGTDRYTSAYQNGLFRQDVLTAWTMQNAGFLIEADYFESLRYRPQISVDEDLWGERIEWYREWITNTNRDDPYWQTGLWKLLKEIPARVKIPVYIGEGWYDHHLGSALRTYQDLSAESKAHSVLRIGAWNHGFAPCVEGTACNNLQNQESLSAFAWFDNLLRRQELPEGKVLIYQIGADRWEERPAFPFQTQDQRIFYFSAHRAGEKVHSLTDDPEKVESHLAFHYNPDNPVMTHGAESVLQSMTEIGSLLQPNPGWREDVISFLSAPMQEDVDILGKIRLNLFVSSSAEDTAFTAKLMEVYPNGQAYNIRSGITTLGYRKSSDLPRMEYAPGTIVEAVIDFWDISWRLHRDSRLRIDISSSDFPQYAIHTNYPGIWSVQAEAKAALQTLYFGPEYPTRVILPISN